MNKQALMVLIHSGIAYLQERYGQKMYIAFALQVVEAIAIAAIDDGMLDRLQNDPKTAEALATFAEPK